MIKTRTGDEYGPHHSHELAIAIANNQMDKLSDMVADLLLYLVEENDGSCDVEWAMLWLLNQKKIPSSLISELMSVYVEGFDTYKIKTRWYN